MKSGFENQVLEFREGSIIAPNMPSGFVEAGPDYNPEAEVMMDWERPLMKRHAEVVCENGGHILEIGFGMGISAGYIQDLKPASHTIVESHPQIYEKLKDWCWERKYNEGKEVNINIVNGRGYDNLKTIKDLGITFDGIFYDAFGDLDVTKFREALLDFNINLPPHPLMKVGTIITFWNTFAEERNFFGFEENITYEKIKINPPKNSYFNNDTYYLPKVVVGWENMAKEFTDGLPGVF